MNLEATIVAFCRSDKGKQLLARHPDAVPALDSVTEMLRRNGWRLTIAYLGSKKSPCIDLLHAACSAAGAPLDISAPMSAVESLRRQALAIEIAAQLKVFGAVFAPNPAPDAVNAAPDGEP